MHALLIVQPPCREATLFFYVPPILLQNTKKTRFLAPKNAFMVMHPGQVKHRYFNYAPTSFFGGADYSSSCFQRMKHGLPSGDTP